MGIAQHDIVLKYSPHEGEGKFASQPFLVRCSCGTEGRFELEETALEWTHKHMQAARSVNITFQNLVIHKATHAAS